MENTDVIVIGAGIAGLCTAFELRMRGRKVTLLDPAQPGSQCSFGNAGALSRSSVAPLAMPGAIKNALGMLIDADSPLYVPPRSWLASTPWLLSFIRASQPSRVRAIAAALNTLLAPSLDDHRRLAERIGASHLLSHTGQLHLYPDLQAMRKDAAGWDLKRSHGVDAEVVDRKAIEALEPAIAERYQAGVFIPGDASLRSPHDYTAAIFHAFTQAGGDFAHSEVRAIGSSGGAWEADNGERTWRAPHLVVAAGAWSQRVLKTTGVRVPLINQRGYHVHLPHSRVSLNRVVALTDRKIFINPMHDGLRIAGTVEFDSLERPLNRERALALKAHAAAGLQGLQFDEESVWLGHRPCLPDSMPVLGEVPDRPGLWCAFGHGHLGMTEGPTTGRWIAEAICEGVAEVMKPFSIRRFIRA
jgi:D-amino-acid dehydrogenase